MNQKTKSLFKVLLSGTILGIFAMLIFIVFASALITKIPHYENYYKIVAVVAWCIPCLISTRVLITNCQQMLLPLALLQAVFIVAVVLLSSIIYNRGFMCINSSATMIICFAVTAVIGVLFPAPKNRKY